MYRQTLTTGGRWIYLLCGELSAAGCVFPVNKQQNMSTQMNPQE
jgi:hypothetical protein